MFNSSFHRKLKLNRYKFTGLFVVIVLIYLSACSTTHNYKTLSFFFDGVPKPAGETQVQLTDTLNSSDTSLLALNAIRKASPSMVVHSPYQDKQCNSCHDQSKMGKLTKSLPDLCYQCHEDFSNKYKAIHGPVAGGQCTMCHSPHTSSNTGLLTRTNQSLCLYCHESKQIMETEAHLTIKDAACTDCHNPHGGENRNFIR